MKCQIDWSFQLITQLTTQSIFGKLVRYQLFLSLKSRKFYLESVSETYRQTMIPLIILKSAADKSCTHSKLIL